jgi:hypothetical protein
VFFFNEILIKKKRMNTRVEENYNGEDNDVKCNESKKERTELELE